MFNYLLVFIGGGIGSIFRYGITQSLLQLNFPPIATFIANALSCILLGFLAGLSLKASLEGHYKLLLMTGVCGGFSTFSTFTAENFVLFQSGDIAYALINILGSVLLCLGCIYLGMKLA